MKLDDIPSDAFDKVIATAVRLCEDIHKRAELQRTLIHVNRFFCCYIMNAPIVSLSEALELRDPLSANIAVRHLARQEDPDKELLNTPQVVGSAIRMRNQKTIPFADRFMESELHVYICKLAETIKRKVYSNFSHFSYGREPLHDMMMSRCWNDDWKKAAQVVIRRKPNQRFINKAIKIASEGGHINCLKLLVELHQQEDQVCYHNTTRSHLRRARCYTYIANVPGMYTRYNDEMCLYFYYTRDMHGKIHAIFGHTTEPDYLYEFIPPDDYYRVVKYDFEYAPPFYIDSVPEILEGVFMYNAKMTDYFHVSSEVASSVCSCMEGTNTINSRSNYELFVVRLMECFGHMTS